jgi:hypothetical protein
MNIIITQIHSFASKQHGYFLNVLNALGTKTTTGCFSWECLQSASFVRGNVSDFVSRGNGSDPAQNLNV